MFKIKNTLLLIVTIILGVLINSCEPEKYYFKNSERNDEIISVELISYTDDDLEVVESIDQIEDLKMDNIILLETLNQSKIEDFISDFSYIEFFQGYPHLNKPNGIGVKINYDNGDFVIMTDTFNSEDLYGGDAFMYNSDGLFLEYYGSVSMLGEFKDIINKYFQTQID